MVQAELQIRNQLGLHLRACQKFVNIATKFQAEVYVRRDDVEINGKSILGLTMLAAEQGTTIVVRTEGSDEVEALAALSKLVEDKFGED